MDDSQERVPAYMIDSSVTYLVKCKDDGYPENWLDLRIEDWVEFGKWYRVLGVVGSKDIMAAELIIWDIEEKYLIQPSSELFTFPASMFNMKDSFMLNNN